jgi:hypothetical protein
MADVQTIAPEDIKVTPKAEGGNAPELPYYVMRDKDGNPLKADAIRVALQENISKADKDRERLEGSLTSKLAILAANFSWLVKNGYVNKNSEETIDWPDSADEQWGVVRAFVVSSCGKDKLTPTINALVPTAIRAGMLVAAGHAKVLKFPWGSSLGDEPATDQEKGGVERIAAPYNVVKPEFVEKGGGKKKERRMPNMADHFTCLNAKHITELWHSTIGKAEMETDGEGVIRRKREQRQPGGAVAGNGQTGGTPGNVVNLEKPQEVFANLVPMFDANKRELANPDIADEVFNLAVCEIKALDWSKIGKDDALWTRFNALFTEMMEINDKYNPDKIEAE